MRKVLERKVFISGKEEIFHCQLLHLEGNFGLVKYVTEKEMLVDEILLPVGTNSLGFFWKEMPFVLYRWFSPQRKLLGDYFSIGCGIELSPKEFRWMDLVVDILVLPDRSVKILDENEIPDGIDKRMRKEIEDGKIFVLGQWEKILEKADRIMKDLKSL